MKSKILFFDLKKVEEEFFYTHQKFDCYDIKFFKESLNEDNLDKIPKEDFENAMVLSVFTSSKLSANVLDKFKNLRLISTRSTAFDHIDLEYCISRNIMVLNVDSFGSSSVAQFTIMLMLMLVRNITMVLNQTNFKDFRFNSLTGRNLNELTLGVVGTGAIGSSVAKIANSFGMKVLAYDIKPKQDLVEHFCITYTDLESLLKHSDIVSLHIPYANNSIHLLDEKNLEKMKNNSYLINVSNINLIDTLALLNFAKSGKFKGIALDVALSEQCHQLADTLNELKALKNVIITPHIAYDTKESLHTILENCCEGISDALSGGFKHRII